MKKVKITKDIQVPTRTGYILSLEEGNTYTVQDYFYDKLVILDCIEKPKTIKMANPVIENKMLNPIDEDKSANSILEDIMSKRKYSKRKKVIE